MKTLSASAAPAVSVTAALLALAASTAAFASLPSVGPDYHQPAVNAPAAFRDNGIDSTTTPADATSTVPAWKTATPADTLARGEWWKLFGDPALDSLESAALAANQDLRAAAARVEQARAAAGLARSAYFPQVALDPSVTRERDSKTLDNSFPQSLSTTERLAVDATWELDLFGRVRRLHESALADLAAGAATFESVRLTLTSDVALNYVALRGLDRELAILRDTVDLRRRAVDIVSARVKSGTATDLDAARAETELATAEAEAAALASRRAATQNALAVLTGQAAPAFTLATAEAALATPPVVPAGLPADLLERRPDVAAAERALAAANARIGVAKAAFFPAISLTGGAGYASSDLNTLFHADSRIWSFGPSLYLPIFQGGRNRANLARSHAAYDEAVATFRQQVLVAFREVQDALTATRLLGDQAEAQDRALVAARRASAIVQKRYDTGFVNYFEVIDAQRTTLATERASVQLSAQRLTTSIALIKALGGGWTRPSDPAAGQVVAQR